MDNEPKVLLTITRLPNDNLGMKIDMKGAEVAATIIELFKFLPDEGKQWVSECFAPIANKPEAIATEEEKCSMEL